MKLHTSTFTPKGKSRKKNMTSTLLDLCFIWSHFDQIWHGQIPQIHGFIDYATQRFIFVMSTLHTCACTCA